MSKAPREVWICRSDNGHWGNVYDAEKVNPEWQGSESSVKYIRADEVERLRAVLRLAQPIVEDKLASLQEFTCEHDEWCTCDYEAQCIVARDAIRAALEGEKE